MSSLLPSLEQTPHNFFHHAFSISLEIPITITITGERPHQRTVAGLLSAKDDQPSRFAFTSKINLTTIPIAFAVAFRYTTASCSTTVAIASCATCWSKLLTQ